MLTGAFTTALAPYVTDNLNDGNNHGFYLTINVAVA
jgi:hypothetical protein